MFQGVSNGIQCAGADEAVEPESMKALWFDIHFVDRVVIYQDQAFVINRLKKCISKTFDARGVCHHVCMWVDIAKRIDLLPIFGRAAIILHLIRFKAHGHIQQVGIFADTMFIIVTFVTAGMRDDEFGWQVEATHQFDGMFYAFALDDARWLQEKEFAVTDPKICADRSGVFIGRGWR